MSKKLMFFFFFSAILCVNAQQEKSSNFYEKGLYANKVSKYDSAIYFFQESISHCKKCSFNELGDIYFALGSSYNNIKNLRKTLETLKKAESYYSKSNFKVGLANTYISFAEFYRFTEDFSSAKLYLKKVDAILENVKIPDRIMARYYNRKSAILIEESFENDDLAMTYSQNSLSIAMKLKDPDLIATSFNEIGYLYERDKNPKAKTYYLKAIKIWDSLDNSLYLCNSLGNLSRYLIVNDKMDEALIYVKQGYEISKKNEFTREIKSFSDFFCSIYEAKGMLKEALEKFRESRHVERLMFKEGWEKVLIDVKEKYEVEKKRQGAHYEWVENKESRFRIKTKCYF